MSTFNLIPSHVRIARRKHRVAVRLLMGCAVYGVICIIGAVVFSMQTHRKHTEGDREFQVISAEAQDITSEINQIMREIAKRRSAPSARSLIGSQPQWDAFLAMLGTAGEEKVVFEEVSCGPTAQDTPDDPIGFETTIIGFAQTHQDVSDFVLRLEEYGVFDTISIERSRREPFLQDHAISFTVSCKLQPAASEEA